MNPTPELAVAVAADVLERIIPSEKVIVSRGCYLHGKSLEKICQVCGLGAVAVAYLMGDSYPEVLPREVVDQELQKDSELTGWQLRELLQSVFPDRQLRLIECAFERYFNGVYVNAPLPLSGAYPSTIYLSRYDVPSTGYLYNKLPDEDRALYDELLVAKEFGKKYDTDEERLQAIMQNVIENGGVFKPGGA